MKPEGLAPGSLLFRLRLNRPPVTSPTDNLPASRPKARRPTSPMRSIAPVGFGKHGTFILSGAGLSSSAESTAHRSNDDISSESLEAKV